MLYIFYGTNEKVIKDKALALISGLQKKAPDAEIVRITQEEVNSVTHKFDIDTLLDTNGLFKQNYLLYLDGIDDVILGFSDIQLEKMKQSEHVCIVCMGKLSAKDKTHLEKYANKMSEYILPKKTERTFNVFNVANALKDRNKPKLWQALADARLKGSEGEALAGMLFWAIKDMLIKKQFEKYSEKELKDLAIHLAELPHKARRDFISIHNALEKFALGAI